MCVVISRRLALVSCRRERRAAASCGELRRRCCRFGNLRCVTDVARMSRCPGGDDLKSPAILYLRWCTTYCVAVQKTHEWRSAGPRTASGRPRSKHDSGF
eukprot:1540821-Prymnesium_polylepis.1